MNEAVSHYFVRMQESVLLNVGFFAKSCVVLVCLCGVHLIVALFFYLTVSTSTKFYYRQIPSDSHIVTSQTHRRAALDIYANGTVETDLNKLIYINASVIKDDVEEPAVLEPCPETSPLLGKFS